MSESREATDGIATAGAAVCALCGAVRDMDTMMIELVDGGMVWVCGGVDADGNDTITDCEARRGI